ncbi:MAG: sigma-70 family RNA polymerase sigma factor [Verrucomicrobiota bacterium]
MPSAPSDAPSSADSADSVEAPRPLRQPAGFATTRWSVVLHAGRAGSQPGSAHEALARLCRTYWFPLYAHVRRRGFSSHDAEDLTQAFFARLLARQSIAQADPTRGRFRAFILTALNHFLADEWDRARTEKRGGTRELLSLDMADAEDRFAQVADPGASPDRMFDREWAVAVLRTVLSRLEEEYDASGKADLFAVLKPTLTGARDSQPYAELAARLGRNENAVKVAVHRLRQRYRALLQAEIADTVASDEDANAEMRALLAALTP